MVNLTLARGLRSRTLDEYRNMAERFDSVLHEVLASARGAKWTAKRAKALLGLLSSRVSKRSFFTTIGESKTCSDVHHFAPRVEGECLFIDCVHVEVHSRHLPRRASVSVAMQLSPHAVERMFQRLRTVDAEEAQHELRTSLLFALPLRVAAKMLALKQVPVPTSHGVFLCNGHDKNPLFARTWLRDNEPDRGTRNISKRWERVVAALRKVEADIRACSEGAAILHLAASGSVEAMGIVVPALLKALEPFPWLGDDYVPGEDEQGATFDLARAQAVAAGD